MRNVGSALQQLVLNCALDANWGFNPTRNNHCDNGTAGLASRHYDDAMQVNLADKLRGKPQKSQPCCAK